MMNSKVEHLLGLSLPTIWGYGKVFKNLVLYNKSYLHQTGWIGSVLAKRPVDARGNPLPFMNYPMIDLLKQRLTGRLSVFEYGSGYSTVFFGGLVRKLVAIEHDNGWFERVKAMAPENVELRRVEADIDGEYCRAIHAAAECYDVVIVDGRDRVNCVLQSLDKLNRRGVIILDDSQRPRYSPIFEQLSNSGFRHLSLRGLKPLGGRGIDETTIFYRTGNCLEI